MHIQKSSASYVSESTIKRGGQPFIDKVKLLLGRRRRAHLHEGHIHGLQGWIQNLCLLGVCSV